MIIRRMDATFGKLRRSSLELGDGLNIIYGENESGKSTWCGFIRAMLYGINTREQSKIGYIADKEKYIPYSGESMHGRMEVQWSGRDILIERTSGRTGVFSSSTVTDLNTGLNVNEIDVPGESMLGIKKEVFERSAFIGQSRIKVENDKGGELERRIVAMAGSGSEESSYSSAEQKLKGWKNKRRYHTRGTAPELEEKILNIKNTLNSLRGDAALLTANQAKLNTLRDVEKEYKKQAEVWKNMRAGEKVNLSRDAALQLKQAEETLKDAIEKAKFGEILPNEDYCDNLCRLYQKYVDAEKGYAMCIENVRKSEKELTAEREKLNAFSLFITDENCNAAADAERARTMLKEMTKLNFFAPFGIVLLSAIIIAVAAYFVCSAIGLGRVIPVWAPSASLTVCGVVASVCAGVAKNGKKKKLKDNLNAIFTLYGAESPEEIEATGAKYHYHKQLFDSCARQTAQLQAELDKAENERERCKIELMSIVCELDEQATAERVPVIIEKLRGNIQHIKEAHAAFKTAAVRYETVKKGNSLDAASQTYAENMADAERPELSEAELEEKLAVTINEIHRLELDCSAIKARMNHVGNQGDLQEQLRASKEKLAIIDADTRAIEYALYELTNASGEMRRRFAPELEKKTGEIFEKLTDGHYRIVEILNPQMEMAVREENASQAHQVLELSAGTADELYLAMRLALSDMLTADESIPLILDDAMVNFDDKRMAEAMSYLYVLSRTRQIIVFSCQKREAEWAVKNGCGRVQSLS